MRKFENDKDCRILLDWLLSHDCLTYRDIHKHLIFSGFDFPSNLAIAYAFFISQYHTYENNHNFQLALVCLQSMIIDQYMEFYNFYPCYNSSGLSGYSCPSMQDFE